MPLSISDWSWRETSRFVFLDVPLKGSRVGNVDVFSTDVYLKVSAPPYLFEVRLCEAVNEGKCSATISNGFVNFKLEKQEERVWTRLSHPNSDDKAWMQKEREAALVHAHKRSDEETKAKVVEKREAERFAIRQQMKQEQDARDAIEQAKQDEINKTTTEIEAWKSKEEQAARILELEEANEKEEISRKSTVTKSVSSERLEKETTDVTRTKKTQRDRGRHESKQRRRNDTQGTDEHIFDTTPPPRQSAKIQVKFTPRLLATPMREARLEEEEEWLKKMAEAGRTPGGASKTEDGDLSERNPLWLKDKGNEFYKAGDYLSAINAYTEALRLNNTMPALYSNRAACRLHLGQYTECVEDCTKALDRLTPPVPANAQSRCRAYVRRAAALTSLELYPNALRDYHAAMKLDPGNEELKRDANKIREIIQGSA
ncbi:dynein axonemal assembly factor 4-like [Corticium candelabrum]|uniref:dynein axonemal assembly factor 4-like n=1 Tax=Corticium candelabrum TaxID=121492 RepID=UPI002E26E029|nr:dynein axonemal assembly factor 4-like [Corticium candelabrum]